MDDANEKNFQRLSEAERSILKSECKMGNCYLGIGVMAAMLFVIFFVVVLDNLPVAVIGAVVLLFLALGACRFVNKELYEDLANDQKLVMVKSLDRLEMNPLPKEVKGSTAFSHRLSNFHEGYAAFSGNSMYYIDKETFGKLQGLTHFEVHYAPHSYILLGVCPVTSSES